MISLDYHSRTDVSESGGRDGTSATEDSDNLLQCRKLKDLCIDKLKELMASFPMYTEKDFALEERGISMFLEKQQTEELEFSLKNIPQIKRRLEAAENQFKMDVGQALSKGWISADIAQYWVKKLHSDEYHWSEKEKFIYNTFPRIIRNWSKLNRDIEKVRNLAKEDEALASLPEVKKVLGKDTKLKKYTSWRGAVSEALAAIEAFKRGRTNLMEDAKKILEKAVRDKVLAPHKVGVWLHRIFRSDVDNKTIREFIYGSASNSLHKLIERWTDVRSRYDAIEVKKKQGMPRGFYFVTTDKFLEWHYGKRLAYVEEAEKRFADIEKENPLILDIRRELDSEDWDSADYLIQKAQYELFSQEDLEKLRSMKQYLKEHRSGGSSAESSKQQTPEEAKAELNGLILLLPPSLQQLYRKAIYVGKFRCLSSLMYNRVWCREKGHVLDDEREAELKEKSTEETEYRLKEGDSKGHIVSDVDSFQQPSIRSYAYTGINKSQTLFLSPQGHDALVAKMQREDSHLFRYWTTLIPEGVDYGTHAYIVKNLHYKMKKCIRIMGSASMPSVNKSSESESSTSQTYSIAA